MYVKTFYVVCLVSRFWGSRAKKSLKMDTTVLKNALNARFCTEPFQKKPENRHDSMLCLVWHWKHRLVWQMDIISKAVCYKTKNELIVRISSFYRQVALWVPSGIRTHDIQNHNLTL